MKRRVPLRSRGRPRHRVSGEPDKAYREYVRAQVCAVRQPAAFIVWHEIVAPPDHGEDALMCRGPVHPHHVKSKGSGGKDAGNLAPLCAAHHDQLHRMGRVSFAGKYAIDLPALARELWATYTDKGDA